MSIIRWLLLAVCLLVGAMMYPVRPKLTDPTNTTTTTEPPNYISLGIHTITAYSSIESCDYPINNLCLMADNKPATIGAIACPRKFLLGTTFLIGNQEYVCRDRLNIKYDDRFDIFMGYDWQDYLKAKQFGIQHLEVLLLTS